MSANVLYDHSGTTFDADLFAANIEASLNGVVRGFGYSIMENGQQGPADGGGVALSQADASAILGIPAPGIAFDEDTRLEIASVSKNFTAAALMIAVENHPFASLDHPMAAYLPTSWTLGNDVETISLRNLLQHTSGFGANYTTTATASNPIVGLAAGAAVNLNFNTFSTNTWANLQTVVAYGVENTYANSSLDDNPQVGSFWYSNLNCSLMRVIIPILSGAVDATETDPQAYADEFRDFLNDNIFGPAGIGNIEMEITGATQARVYRPVFSDPAAVSAGATEGTDRTLVAGAYGLKMTPSDIATAAAYLYNEDTSPLSPGAIQEMQDQLLGFLASRSQPNGNYGAYYAHDGSFTDDGLGTVASQLRRMLSTVNVFPNDVQAAVIVNSDTIGGLNMSAIVQNAYDNSWRRVAVGGSSGNDTFVIDTDAGGNNVILTITTPSSTETLTAPVSVLEELTLEGFNGDDVFIVNRLPASVALSIRAGFGSDRLDVASTARDLDVINGPLHFAGGSGDVTDRVFLHDENDTGNDNYSIVTDPPSTVSRPGFLLSHTGVEDLTLNANDGNNNITMGGSWALQTTNYTINAAAGNDTVTVNASAPMNVLVNGGAGTVDQVQIRATLNDDEVTLRDRTVTIGATQVTFGTGVERRSLDAQAGTDLLTVIGVDGNDEHIIVRASATPGSGSVQTPSTLLNFVSLEDVTVQGNPGDHDTLAFYGTAQADDFAINPVAQGTADSVVASLGNGLGSTLLRLRDFSHVGIPTFFGGYGADTFRVTVFPTTPEFAIRSVRLDGGTERSGARPAVDTLIMNYNESLFTQLSPPATAPTGTVRLQHADELLAVLYGNFEAVLGNIL